MTLDEFIEKYNHKKVDFDGAFGAQCVDLFRQYCRDVLNIPHTGVVVGAKDLYEKYDQLPLEKKYFEKIKYESQTPRVGDVVIFKATPQNRYGHVAIVLEADSLQLTAFEQDGFRQDGAKKATWSYQRVMGFLRKREVIV